ncbi:MAG: acyl-CoA dehydrogenase, partial [Nitrospinae bacterium]|nr:acyl-CoA dehydrogenase [Nitrospinota bacterium]
ISFLSVLLWLLFLVIVLPLSVTPLRKSFISIKVLEIYRKIMPAISQTEREALEAGNVWWDKELFSGKPNWDVLLDAPITTLSPDERAFLDGPVEELCRLVDDWKTTRENQGLSEDAWEFIKVNGFFGMIIPKKYGGLEFSVQTHSLVIQKLASRSITAAVTVMVPNSLGPAELILNYGTEDQKNFYLPRLARGEEIPCFALTGPEAGSDASSIPDTGIICKKEFNGEERLGVLLNWEKRYITLGPVATVLGLAFKLYDPNHLIGEKESLGITCALIPTELEGVSIGERHLPLDSAFLTGPTYGKDVFIPIEAVIGGQNGCGKGWGMLMECLAAGRSISLPALSCGASKLVSRYIGGYSRIRKQFKISIAKFEGVEEVLARIAGNTYIMEGARTLTASAVDLGNKPSVISAIVKYNLTERMRGVVNDGMDIQGGAGICLGPQNILGRAYESVPISITVEGANILTRTFIIFNQGIIRCHPYLLQEMSSVHNQNRTEALIEFDQAFFGHLGFATSNFVRALVMNLTGGRLTLSPVKGKVAKYYQQINRLSASFAFLSDLTLLVVGGGLKRKEKLSGRLADVLSQMYLVTAALKKYENDGRLEEDFPLLKWSCDDALYKAQTQLEGILENYPIPVVGKILSYFIFPFGRPFKQVSDRNGRSVASTITGPSEVRNRLTHGIYIPKDNEEAAGLLETALDAVVAAEDVEEKIKRAIKLGKITSQNKEEIREEAVKKEIINQDEVKILVRAESLRRNVIAVDSFFSEKINVKSNKQVPEEQETSDPTKNIQS